MSADKTFHSHSTGGELIDGVSGSCAGKRMPMDIGLPLRHVDDDSLCWGSQKRRERRTCTRKSRSGGCRGAQESANSTQQRCSAARSLAVQWLSSLVQNPPDASRLQAYREQRRQRQEQGSSHVETGSTVVVEEGVPKGTSFADLVRIRSAAGFSFSASSVAVGTVSDAVTQRDGNFKSSRSHFSTNTFEPIPEDEESIPRVIEALREIALTGASLETIFLPKDDAGLNGGSSLVTRLHGNVGTSCGEGIDAIAGESHNTSMSSSHSCNSGSSPSSAVEGEWGNIRMHFRTVHQLLQNREELMLILDTTLGSDWCHEDEASAKNAETCCSGEVKFPPSQAVRTGVITQRTSSIAENTSGHNQEEEEDEQEEVGGGEDAELVVVLAVEEEEEQQQRKKQKHNEEEEVTVGSGKIQSTLNHKAAPFESRLHSLLATPPLGATPYHFPGGSLTAPNNIDSLGTSPLLLPTPPMHHSNPSTVEPAGTGMMPASSATVINNSTPPPTSTVSSPSTVFQLESREDMLRRRSAAAASAAAASNYVHNAPGNYYGNRPRGYVSPPLGFMNTTVSRSNCPYDYVLVLDFEATCEEFPPPSYLHEIIEFPVVLVDVQSQRAVAEFHQYVKPKLKPQLSDFCRSLTGIRQEDIDKASPLEEVIRQFERWYARTIPHGSRTILATDGPADLSDFMYVHSVTRQGIRFPSMFYQWIDVKRLFAKVFHCQQGKIKAMLEVLQYPLEGRLHSGIDDARNVANIVIGLLKVGCSLREIPLSSLPYGIKISTASLLAQDVVTVTTPTVHDEKTSSSS